MPDPVNLRRYRKARLRAEAAETAAEHRARFGRTRAERDAVKAAETRAARTLEGHRIDAPDASGDGP